MTNYQKGLDQSKHPEMQCFQDPNQTNVDILNHVIREASRHFRIKEGIPVSYTKDLETNIEIKIPKTCIGASTSFCRFSSLELI
jgi:hypothetical protein